MLFRQMLLSHKYNYKLHSLVTECLHQEEHTVGWHCPFTICPFSPSNYQTSRTITLLCCLFEKLGTHLSLEHNKYSVCLSYLLWIIIIYIPFSTYISTDICRLRYLYFPNKTELTAIEVQHPLLSHTLINTLDLGRPTDPQAATCSVLRFYIKHLGHIIISQNIFLYFFFIMKGQWLVISYALIVYGLNKIAAITARWDAALAWFLNFPAILQFRIQEVNSGS